MKKPRLSESDRHAVLHIVAIYAVFSCLWIYLSDLALGLVFSKVATIIYWSTFKGYLFISISVVLLYNLMAQYLRNIRRTEEALLNEKIGYGLLIENLPVGVVVLDSSAAIVLNNQEGERILGIPTEELHGMTLSTPSWSFVREDGTLLPPEEFAVRQVMQRRSAIKQSVMGLSRGVDKGRTWVLVNAYPKLDEKGKIRQIVLILDDISDMKSAEKRMKRHVEHLTALVEIDRAINFSFDLNVSLTTLLAHAVAQLDIDAAAVLLFDPATQRLDYFAGHGFYARSIEHQHLCLGEGYAGRVAQEQRIIQINNVTTEDGQITEKCCLAREGFVSYCGVPLLAKGELKGVLEVFHRAPFTPHEEWLNFVSALGSQAAIAIDNTTLFSHLQHSNQELTLAYDATIAGWSRALDLRDHATEGHSQRVATMTVNLARILGMSDADLVQVRWGSLLHDIGKMGVPDDILLKEERLTESEWGIMKEHPVLAYELLAPVRYLRGAIDIPYAHHERWDGSGYPRGLKGEEIPLAARIFAVADVWDALSSERPYRTPWRGTEISAHLQALAGTHFDPQVVKVALESKIFEDGDNE